MMDSQLAEKKNGTEILSSPVWLITRCLVEMYRLLVSLFRVVECSSVSPVKDHIIRGEKSSPLQLVADIDDIHAVDGWGGDPLAIAIENFQCSDLARCQECQDWAATSHVSMKTSKSRQS
jgi:hypothetical protein